MSTADEAPAGVRAEFVAVRRLIGKGGDKLLPEVSGIDAESSQGKAISDRRGEIFQTQYLPNLKPFPGAKELLARMKQAGLELAVASSSKRDELTGFQCDIAIPKGGYVPIDPESLMPQELGHAVGLGGPVHKRYEGRAFMDRLKDTMTVADADVTGYDASVRHPRRRGRAARHRAEPGECGRGGRGGREEAEGLTATAVRIGRRGLFESLAEIILPVLGQHRRPHRPAENPVG